MDRRSADHPYHTSSGRPHNGQNDERRGHPKTTDRTLQGETELTELAAPAPAPPEERRRSSFEANESAIKREERSSSDVAHDQTLTEAAAPSPVEQHQQQQYRHESPKSKSDEETPSSDNTNGNSKSPQKHNQAGKVSSPAITELYTVSWLIFFSFWGTLARLGLEAITLYPNTPFSSRVLWPNVGGSFVLGALTEDRRLFREEWGRPDPDASWSTHGKVKKTIPLYIGLATGFCGCFTSFSSFIRDAFLALTNALESPAPHSPYHTDVTVPSRSGGYSFLALMAIVIIQPAVSLSALKAGAHFALLLQPVTPVIPFRLTRKFLDPLGVVLAFVCWFGAIIISIFPPGNNGNSSYSIHWRFRAAFPLVFAPAGCLLRFYLSKHMNALVPSFPLGTFAANIFGTIVLGMAWDLQHARSIGASSHVSCSVLQGIMEGFCGCLTTVSTWALELSSLRRRHAWIYGFSSVWVGIGFLVIIMGSMGWTVGFARPTCS